MKIGEIKGVIKMCREIQIDKCEAINKLVQKFQINEKEALTYIEEYWQ